MPEENGSNHDTFGYQKCDGNELCYYNSKNVVAQM